LALMPPEGRVIAIDKDKESLLKSKASLEGFTDRVTFFHADYQDIDKILDSLHIDKVEAFLFDLGTSLYQLSSFGRGFSFLREGPLDMRMDRTASISAYDLINHLSEKELDFIFKEYGQERLHKLIAHEITEERKSYPIATTMQLALIIEKAVGSRYKKYKLHPATRVFQALRIAVNNELDSLKTGLRKAMDYLGVGGRICVIDFHSLEDKIVKHLFREFKSEGIGHILTSRPLRPCFEEKKYNPRSRSAKMRVIEKAEEMVTA
jgi:16S rRNA (cytosine1402-N4)-methyltransferase